VRGKGTHPQLLAYILEVIVCTQRALLKMGCSETPFGHYALLVIKATFDLF